MGGGREKMRQTHRLEPAAYVAPQNGERYDSTKPSQVPKNPSQIFHYN